VKISDLKEVFRRNGTTPQCLQEVLDDLALEDDIQEKEAFLEVPEKSWIGWGVNTLMKKPIKFGFGLIKERVMSNNKEERVFVVKSAVKRQATIMQSIVKKCHSYNNIVTMEDLIKSLTDTGISSEGISLALHYLSCLDKVYIEHNDDQDEKHHHKTLLKFAEPHMTVAPITEMQRSIFNLEHTEKFLITVMGDKEMAIDELMAKIRECLKDGKKQTAKTYLKKKHAFDKDLEKTSQILENVQAMLQRVHGAKSDKEIINTYKMGSNAIKSAFASAGLDLDSVDDIIEDMKEVFEKEQDIQAAISEPMRGGVEIDDSELEKELLDLVNDDKDNNDNNSFNQIKKKDKEDKFDDDEIERRLQRLRSDFHDPESTNSTSTRREILHNN
jgi:charged multivesicular body protein 7